MSRPRSMPCSKPRLLPEGSARESTAATMHRQPTPRSIAAAEAQLGNISQEQLTAVEGLMTDARAAV